MFSERALKELASVESQGPILSVYLNVDPTQRTADEYRLELREMLKAVNGCRKDWSARWRWRAWPPSSDWSVV